MIYNLIAFNRSEPEGTRTPNLLVRSQMLYPIKLQVLFVIFWSVAIRRLADNYVTGRAVHADANIAIFGKKSYLKLVKVW